MKRKCLFLLLLVSFLNFSFWLAVWTSKAESQAHFCPKYKKEDISGILAKEELSEEDYESLLRQTGMSRVGVDELFERGEEQALFYLQERYFADVEVECLRSNIFVQYERIVEDELLTGGGEFLASAGKTITVASGANGRDFLPEIREGDILLSFSGHIFGWRYGHAAIVVDAERGLTVEAVELGSDSKLRPVECWDEYPGFVLLRPVGVPPEKRRAAVQYAKESLVGLPYSVFALGSGEDLSGTQCAHLVWCAYEHAGIDLDSDGGVIVTPEDLLRSEFLEIVQIYGISIG